ncbi:hypothetical protein, partial [Mycobacterium tuberculosis]
GATGATGTFDAGADGHGGNGG